MKNLQFLTIALLITATCNVFAQPRRATLWDATNRDQFIGCISYYCDERTWEATVMDIHKTDGYYYGDVEESGFPMTVATIPQSLKFSSQGISMAEDAHDYDYMFSVTTLGEHAFHKAVLKGITFTEPTNVRKLDVYAMAEMCKIPTSVTLPEGIQEMDSCALFTGTSSISTQQMKTTSLVLPASLTTLASASIVLTKLTKIEFKGKTPPTCEVRYNDKHELIACPWIFDNGTKRLVVDPSIEIVYPEGADEAYKSAPGIGDYFTQLQSGTALDKTKVEVAPATKSLRNGILIIERNGVRYDAQGRRQMME